MAQTQREASTGTTAAPNLTATEMARKTVPSAGWRRHLRSDGVSGHKGKGYFAGTRRTGDHPKRAMPKLHRHQATRAAGVSISPSVALPRLKSAVR